MTKNLLSAVLVTSLALAAPASAPFAKPDHAVKYRQSALALIGNHMSRINGQLKSGTPDLKSIQSSAALVQTLASLPFEAFPPGSEAVANSRTKPELWKDGAKIRELTERMQAEVARLNAAAAGGDLKAIQAQVGAVGQSYKPCHDDYRAR